MSSDDIIIDTPDGPMTFAQWKKKHPVQIPSRRTKGKDLPVKVQLITEPPADKVSAKKPATKKPRSR